MKFHLDHIGIACKDLEHIKTAFTDLFGTEFDEGDIVSDHGVKVTFSEKPSEGTRLEFLEAVSESSGVFTMLKNPIKSFVDKNGNGLHHLSFRVDNLDDAINELNEKGATIFGNIKTGHGGHRVAFINLSMTEGILVELVETK